jgi:propanol-preferring alcohol dehydrogenase
MRAMQLTAPASAWSSPLNLTTRPQLHPSRGELRLSVIACAVCRTDLQLVEGDLLARRLPIVPGHQAVGRVAEIGKGVTGWQLGERAGVTWLAGACGRCEHCLNGLENLCPSATFTGWDRDGGFGDELVVQADVAVRIPAAFDDIAAAPLLCGGVIGHRALRLAGVPGIEEQRAGQSRAEFRLGLYGFGASASLAIQEARHLGCEVHVATRSIEERERAAALGAASVAGYDDPPPAPLQAAITFAPVGSVIVSALAALAPGGTVVVNAIHLDGVPAFPYDLLWGERVLRSVTNVTRRDAAEFMALAAGIPIRTSVRTYPLEDANLGLVDLATGKIGASAAVLTVGQSPEP